MPELLNEVMPTEPRIELVTGDSEEAHVLGHNVNITGRVPLTAVPNLLRCLHFFVEWSGEFLRCRPAGELTNGATVGDAHRALLYQSTKSL